MAKSATGACVYGLWYLLDTKHEKVLCAGGKPICTGPGHRKGPLRRRLHGPKDATVKAVHVNPGTVIVQARPIENEGKVIAASPNSFYVLNDEALLNGSDIKNPLASTDQNTGQPDVTFSFTPHGGEVFEHVTKQIAERGRDARLPGVSVEHAAAALRDRARRPALTVPIIDYTQYADGIDRGGGAEISGGVPISDRARTSRSCCRPARCRSSSSPLERPRLGDARQGLARPGARRGDRRADPRRALPARALPLPRPGRGRRPRRLRGADVRRDPAPGVTLTLPGFAGLILTIGVAADANVVIFERIKEEVRAGARCAPRSPPATPRASARSSTRTSSPRSPRSSSSGSRPPRSRASR